MEELSYPSNSKPLKFIKIIFYNDLFVTMKFSRRVTRILTKIKLRSFEQEKDIDVVFDKDIDKDINVVLGDTPINKTGKL